MTQIPNDFPSDWVETLRKLVPASQANEILDSLSRPRLTSFRVNTLKTTISALADILTKAGFTFDHIHWCEGAYVLRKQSLRVLTEHDSYKTGQLYVQSLSSMVPALVLDPQPNEKILDLCAAPGSKTTQIAAMMKNSGSIVANDTSMIRNYRLKANCQLQGVSNVIFDRADGRSLWQKYPEFFDRTLVDVPCSMDGRFQFLEPKSYLSWTPKKAKELSKLQRWLLRSAVSATKPGGVVVYSTCTISPIENEAVVDWILQKEKGSIELDTITMNGIPSKIGMTTWLSQTFSQDMIKTLRIYPDELYEGFFVAKFKKIKSTI